MTSVNIRHALRALIKTPFVSIVAVLSLSLGIGANAAMFSVFNQAILRPLPVPQPEQLVNLLAPGPKPGSQATWRTTVRRSAGPGCWSPAAILLCCSCGRPSGG